MFQQPLYSIIEVIIELEVISKDLLICTERESADRSILGPEWGEEGAQGRHLQLGWIPGHFLHDLQVALTASGGGIRGP